MKNHRRLAIGEWGSAIGGSAIRCSLLDTVSIQATWKLTEKINSAMQDEGEDSGGFYRRHRCRECLGLARWLANGSELPNLNTSQLSQEKKKNREIDMPRSNRAANTGGFLRSFYVQSCACVITGAFLRYISVQPEEASVKCMKFIST